MLASVEHRFVLLCNPKCATTSLRRMYRPYCNFNTSGELRWKHLNWRDYRSIFGDFFDRHGCETYAVVRDPVDLLHSWWRFRQRPQIQDPAHPRHAHSTVGVPFEQFVEEWASDYPAQPRTFGNQRSMLMTGDGRPAPIRFYRYDEVDRLIERLNEHVGADVEKVRLNVSPHDTSDIDRGCVSSLPRMREQLDFVASIDIE